MRNIIHDKLMAALDPLILEVMDESHKHKGHVGARPDGNTHFKIRIISNTFTPMSRLERHRFVHEILKDELQDKIHALSLTLLTSDENSRHD